MLAEPGVDDEQVTRLVLCTGKIYYDLVGHPERASHTGLAVARVELLYPFPEGQLLALMGRYPNLREVLWVQEEPRNMGARAHMFPRLMQIMPPEMHFGYVGRPERASPARATRPPTPPNRAASSRPRSTFASRSRSTRARRRVSADGRALAAVQADPRSAPAQEADAGIAA